jgi:hypothetical protein
MGKKLLSEAAKEIFNASKGKSGEGPKKLEGEVKTIVGATPTEPLKASDKPEFATKGEDKSKPKKGAKAGESQEVMSTAVIPGQSKGPAPHMESVEEDDALTLEGVIELAKDSLDEEGFNDFVADLEATKTDEEFDEVVEGFLALVNEAEESSEEDDEAPVVVEAEEVTPIEIALTPIDVREHMEALFAGDTEKNLSDEFKAKAATIFEAALNAKIAEVKVEAEKLAEAAVTERVATQVKDLNEKFDEHLNYIGNQWLETNKVEIETNLRTELTESFIAGLRKLMVENQIDVPEDKIDIMNELAQELESTKSQLNEQITANSKLNNVILEAKKNEIVNVLAEGLTDIEADKFFKLTEGLDGKLLEADFAKKAQVLRESHFTKADPLTEEAKKKIAPMLDEEKVLTEDENDKQVLEEETSQKQVVAPVATPAPQMAAYLKAMKRHNG